MDQLEQNQVAMREDMLIMRAHMGQIMEVMQAMARDQEEVQRENLRVAASNPSITSPVNLLGGIGTPIVTQQPPEEGPVNQNDGLIFNISVNMGLNLI